MKKGALEGLRVLDFTVMAAGPLVTKFLSDHGAEVIKLESTVRPDVIRTFIPFAGGTPGINRSITFAEGNTGKYSFRLNLSHPLGIDIAKRLASCCDIVVENFNPGVMKKHGLTYDDLTKIKSDVIMVSMSGLGQSGPHSRHRNIGLSIQALAGINHFTGWPDRAPIGYSIPYPDVIIPWFALLALMAAVDYRKRTGKGQYIDVTMLETSLHFLAPALLDYTANGREGTRMGNRCAYAAPHGVYRCQGEDRWCAIEVFNDDWPSFCKVLGNPAWSKEPQFATLLGRKENEEELDRLVEDWTAKRSAEEVMSLMQQAGVGAGVVQNAEDIADKDPHFKYRQFYQVVEHPEIGAYECPTASFKLSKTPCELSPAPCLGEHNEYVCTKILGMSDKEFSELVASGVFE